MTATVTSIKPSRISTNHSKKQPTAKRAAPGTSKAAIKRRKHLRIAASTFAGTTAAIMAVSLSHLAHGIQAVTGGAVWEAWALAVAIDVGILAVEAMALIDAGRMERVCKPYIVGVLVASAGLNVMAFTANAAGNIGLAFGVIAGVALPAAYYGAGHILAKAFKD